MTRKTKKLEISEAKIRQAIWYLKKKKTKKFVCEHLGIKYNTKRLDSIIKEFNEGLARDKRLKAAAKVKVFSNAEINSIIKEYLNGGTQTGIAKEWYISAARVKKILVENNVPIRARGKNKKATVAHIVQDLDVQFNNNDRVFIAKYNCFGVIKQIYDEKYVEYLERGTQRYVELTKFIRGRNNYLEPKIGIHYEIYWVLEDGKEMKMSAVNRLRNNILAILEDTGREYYLVWRDDDYAGNYYLSREQLYPVVQ